MADRISELERKVGNLEHRVASLFPPASLVGVPKAPKGKAMTPEEALVDLIRTRLRLHLRHVDIDFALSQVRSQKFDDQLLAIFCRPASR